MTSPEVSAAEWEAAVDRLNTAAVDLLVRCSRVRSVGAVEVELLRELVDDLEHVTQLLHDLHELPAETWELLAALEEQLANG